MRMWMVLVAVAAVDLSGFKVEIDEEKAAEQRQVRMFACLGVAKFWMQDNEILIAKLAKRTPHSVDTIKEKLTADIVLPCYKEIALETAQELMKHKAINPQDPAVRKWTLVDWEQFYTGKKVTLTREQEDLITIAEDDRDTLKAEKEENIDSEEAKKLQFAPIVEPIIPVVAIGLAFSVALCVYFRRSKPAVVARKDKKTK
jgi:hypothetical protein